MSLPRQSDFPAGQNWIIKPMKGLKYRSHTKGVCHAIGLAGMIEIFSHNVAGFDSYLSLLHSYKYNQRNLEDDISEVKSYLSKKYEDYYNQIIHTMNDIDNINDQLSTMLEVHTNDTHNNLSAKQRSLLEIDALFNLIEIKYKNTVHKVLLSSTNDYNLTDMEVISLILPASLREKGGIEKAFQFKNLYNKESLCAVLETLRNHVVNHPELSEPPVFIISNDDHLICLGYDRSRNNWILINANKMSIRYISHDDLLTDKLISGFFGTDGVYLTIEFYSMKLDTDKLLEIINNQENTTMFIRNHDLVHKDNATASLNEEYIIAALGDSILHNQPKVVKSILCQLNDTQKLFLPFALYQAVFNKKHDIVKIMLDANINPNKKIAKALLPLHAAIINGDEKMVSLLLSYDAKVYINDFKNENAIDIAKFHNKMEILKLLNNQLEADILIAATMGKAKLLERLININPEFIHSMFANTALYLAVDKGHQSAVEVLINAGISPNKVRGKDYLPLHVAVKNCDLEMISLLLALGSKPYITNSKNENAIDIAGQSSNSNKDKMITLLRPSESLWLKNLWDDLFNACKDGDIKIVKDILKAGINPKDKTASIALSLAGRNGHYDVVKALLEAGFNPFKKIGKRLPCAFQYAGESNKNIQELMRQYPVNNEKNPSGHHTITSSMI